MPSNMLNADIGFPSLKGKSSKEQIEIITNYLFMLLEQLRYTLANLGADNFNESELDGLKKTFTGDLEIKVTDLEGNVTTITQTVSKIETKVEDVEGNLSQVTQTVDGIQSTVKNIEGEFSEVKQDVNGLQITTSGGTTFITGDHVKSGTIEGSRLVCSLNSSQGASDGELVFKYNGVTVGRIQMDTYGDSDGTGSESKYRVFVEAMSNFVLKLLSDSDLSVTSKTGSIYVGANSGRVNLVGANGCVIRPYSGTSYTFEQDGIYLNGSKIAPAEVV